MTIALFSEEVKDRAFRSLTSYEGKGVDEACEAIHNATEGWGVSIVAVRDLSSCDSFEARSIKHGEYLRVFS